MQAADITAFPYGLHTFPASYKSCPNILQAHISSSIVSAPSSPIQDLKKVHEANEEKTRRGDILGTIPPLKRLLKQVKLWHIQLSMKVTDRPTVPPV